MSRALVLGGGGVAGIAWETGLLFGLSERGVDVRDADLVVGTSAGAAVGAQLLSGTPLAELYDRHVLPDRPAAEIQVDVDLEKMVNDWAALLTGLQPGVQMRAAIGRYALTAPTTSERARRAVIEARLPSHDWPSTPLHIVAVDAATGADRVFTRDDGVSLVDAVAASCAVPGIWPAVTIAGRRYVDGGVRTSANVDLAEGYDIVLLLAPIADLLAPEPAIAERLDRLDRAARVLTVRPNESSLAAFGSNPLDPATAGPAARAGHAQAALIADDVAELWYG